MAVVLFIITIPTEAEELKLRSASRSERSDALANYVRDDKLISTPITATTTTTSATLSNFSNETTATAAVTINVPEQQAGNNEEIDVVSLSAKMENPLEPLFTQDQQQYSTFPKRRKSEANKFFISDAVHLLSKSSAVPESSTGSASDSTKEVEKENTVRLIDSLPNLCMFLYYYISSAIFL